MPNEIKATKDTYCRATTPEHIPAEDDPGICRKCGALLKTTEATLPDKQSKCEIHAFDHGNDACDKFDHAFRGEWDNNDRTMDERTAFINGWEAHFMYCGLVGETEQAKGHKCDGTCAACLEGALRRDE